MEPELVLPTGSQPVDASLARILEFLESRALIAPRRAAVGVGE